MEWIRTKDEWPPEGQVVLVHGGVAYHNGKVWKTITGETWPGKPIQWHVTHWMALPAPPDAMNAKG